MATRPKTETVRRIVVFEAQAGSFQKALTSIDRSSASAAKSLQRIDDSTKKTSLSVNGLYSAMLKFNIALKAFGTLYAAQQIVNIGTAAFNAGKYLVGAGDAMTLMRTRIERLGNNTATFDQVATLAYDLGLSFADAADNVALVAPAFDKLGIPFQEVTKFSENLTNSLRVYGTDARRAQIVTVQLTQALASGNLAGDELKSLNENAGALGLSLERAVQSALKTNKSIKQLGTEGKLTTPVVLKAFEGVFKGLEKDIGKLPDLFVYQTARLSNSWTRLMATLDEKLKTSELYKFLSDGARKFIDEINANLNQNAGTLANYAAGLGEKELFAQINETTSEIARLQEDLVKIKQSYEDVVTIAESGTTAQYLAEQQLNKVLERRLFLANELAKRTKTQAEAATRAAQGGYFDIGEFDSAVASISKALNLTDEGAENLKKFFPTIAEGAKKAQIPVERVIALINNESRFTQFGNSVSSATGPMQILESTAKGLAEQLSLDFEKIRTGTDGWESNIVAGIEYLAKMAANSKSEVETLAKYFLGPGGAAAGLDYIPKGNSITGREYSEGILKKEALIREALGATDRAFETRMSTLERAGKLEQQYASARVKFDNIFRENLDLLDEGILSQEAYVASILDAAKALKGLTVTEEEAQEIEKRRIEGLIALETEQRNLNQQFTDARDAFNELLSSLDPTIAAEAEYAAGIAVVVRALQLKVVSAEKAALAVDRLLTRSKELVAEQVKLSGTIEGLGLQLQDTAFASFNSWIDSAIQGTFSLKEALVDLTKELVAMALKFAIFKALSGAFPNQDFSGAFGYKANAIGYAYPKGINLDPGIYTSPTLFKFASGGRIGLLGEAGAEAVLPLTRTSNGDLGVKSKPAQMNIVVNNNASGVEVVPRQVDSETIELTIREIESRINRGGNSTSRTFEQVYGTRRQR